MNELDLYHLCKIWFGNFLFGYISISIHNVAPRNHLILQWWILLVKRKKFEFKIIFFIYVIIYRHLLKVILIWKHIPKLTINMGMLLQEFIEKQITDPLKKKSTVASGIAVCSLFSGVWVLGWGEVGIWNICREKLSSYCR